MRVLKYLLGHRGGGGGGVVVLLNEQFIDSTIQFHSNEIKFPQFTGPIRGKELLSQR